MPIATLITSAALASEQLEAAQDYLNDVGLSSTDIIWVDEGRVADIHFLGSVEQAQSALIPLADHLDYVVQCVEDREKKLLISDMDSTMITVECIDELADYAGIKDQIAQVTEAAMRGEMDFEEALRGRVALLKGLEMQHIETCLRERVCMSKGAKTLVQTMAARGAHCVLVSGGFTQFAASVSQQLGFHEFCANELAISNDILSGEITGDIVDAQRKRTILEQLISDRGLKASETLAVGDGANDIPMIEAAGLGVAYKAKPAAEGAADMMVRQGDLSALLSAQGIACKDWVV